MPSSTSKQHRFMEAVAHCMKPRKGGPSRAVAEEFVEADARERPPKRGSVTAKRARNNRLGKPADRVDHLTTRSYD